MLAVQMRRSRRQYLFSASALPKCLTEHLIFRDWNKKHKKCNKQVLLPASHLFFHQMLQASFSHTLTI